MKTKLSDKLTCILFCGFLFGMLVLYLLLPEQTFSEKEKRYLAEKPAMETETMLSGAWGNQAETYMADHIPGRDFFVGVNAYYDLLSGRQVTKDIYLADQDRLVEAPYSNDQEAIEKNMRAINRFAESVGQNVDLIIVPTAGYIYEDDVVGIHDDYQDDVIIADIYRQAGENVTTYDLLPAFTDAENPASLYYRTDHHWTSYGAYIAYSDYMQRLGRDYPVADTFRVESRKGFLGSNYSRSGLWNIPAETVELWKNDTGFTVSNSENPEPHAGLFYEERLEELDKYTVFLDGNHGMVTIHNPNAVGKGSLLVIRDSYANCLGTFLANSYENVILVDLRYYKKPVSELMETQDFSNVLICYSMGNFLTDENIIWLR